jgi:hypothetical protein
MGFFDFAKKPKTLDEEQEEDDRLTVEHSIWQKKAAIAELKRRGQDANNFKEGGKFNWSKIWTWLKTH